MASSYGVYIRPQAWQQIKNLPGNVRQRVKRALDPLEVTPRPTNGKQLQNLESPHEIWRLRLDDRRVLYVIQEELEQIQVLAIRPRPSYAYSDLDELLKSLD